MGEKPKPEQTKKYVKLETKSRYLYNIKVKKENLFKKN